jgi:hypothetical protein
MYDTNEEANQKLKQTVVLLKKSPVWIMEATGGHKKVELTHHNLRGGTVSKTPIFSPDWEFRDLGSRLGYANMIYGNLLEATYVQRAPVRQAHNTQGLSAKNLIITPLKGSQRLGIPQVNLDFNTFYPTAPFCDMLEGKYLQIEQIMNEFQKNMYVISRAFNREFAVRRADVGPFYLQYKGKDIGHTDDFYKWKIAPQFKYLNETLDHIKLKVA